MEEKKLKDYVIVPRQVAADYRTGILSRTERDVYLWVRINANPYGIAHVSLESVAGDVFGSSAKKNYVNKILLSLKEKRYIFYEQRSGRRGSFEMHFGDWLLPSGKNGEKSSVKTLDHYFEMATVRRRKLVLTQPHSEHYVEDAFHFQKSAPEKSDANVGDSATQEESPVRGADNDTDQDTETETNHLFAYGKRDLSLKGFVPRSCEEEVCHALAKELGEHDMAFLVGTLKKHGFSVIEKAFIKLQKAVKKGGVDNPRRLFNYIVQQEADPNIALLKPERKRISNDFG